MSAPPAGRGQHSAWLALNGLFLLLAALYALATPPFEAPDAGAHYGYIVYLHQNRTLPRVDTQHAATSHQLVQQPPLYYALAAAATAGLPVERGLELLRPNPQYLKGLTFRATATVPDADWEAQAPVWVARAVSLLGALLAVNASLLLVRTLFPGAFWLALAVAGVVAFNPRFLFSAGTITNDAWAAGTATLAMWLTLRAAGAPARRAGWLGAGAALGLAALAKYGNLALAAPVLVILALAWRRAGERQTLAAALLLAAGAAAVAGFWYLHNWQTAGQLVPLEPMLAVLPGLARPAPLPLAGLPAALPLLQNSYWGEFGYGVLAPPWFFAAVQWALLAAATGLGIGVARALIRRDAAARLVLFAVALAGVWAAAVFVSLLNWMRLVNFTAQGRLLFPAVGAVALLLVLGWQSWAPARGRRFVHMTILLVFIGLAASQLGVLHDAYRLPPPISEPLQPARTVHARFAGGIELVGADLPAGAALDGREALPLTLYWRAHNQIAEFYTLFIHLTDSQGQMLYQFDGVPVQARHPTAQWVPGALFADSYELRPVTTLRDDLAVLTVGFYRHDNPAERLAVVDDTGAPVADVVTLAQVRLNAQTPACPDRPAPVAAWENGIQLLDQQVIGRGAGVPPEIRLTWSAERTIHENYTVFLHALDADGKIVGQIDRWPQDGAYPTSTWRRGNCVVDTYTFAELAPSWERIVLGLYDAQFQRLRRADGSDVVKLEIGN